MSAPTPDPPIVWVCTGCGHALDGNPRLCPYCGYTVYRPTRPTPEPVTETPGSTPAPVWPNDEESQRLHGLPGVDWLHEVSRQVAAREVAARAIAAEGWVAVLGENSAFLAEQRDAARAEVADLRAEVARLRHHIKACRQDHVDPHRSVVFCDCGRVFDADNWIVAVIMHAKHAQESTA
jgi:hypothetical protein